MTLNKKVKKLIGFGLIEILISLAIFAVGVISITSLNIKTYRVIKNNEMADFAERVMVKALEYFKSPTTDDVQKWLETSLNGSTQARYRITTAVDDGTQLEFEKFSSGVNMITTCESGNQFRVLTVSNSQYDGIEMCVEVEVDKKNYGYQIISKVVYKIDSETKNNVLVGYRPFTYDKK